ncbi:hypothetical protein G4V62_00715 [Bacillaceae bacterium SIJ1]|uniref:hypothetical protein n=1 Tax=Litoribacterium kuwaitense TaxID=1398745 RepID=UPI0013EE262D|nr:hypothetical protein [Litoribacterium kuwaitense]NGP43554.1 hypothetical protein [Litoribacterium kuwaitense]
MTTAVIVLLCISIVLLVLSFFTRDRVKVVEEQLEQLTIQTAQENYQLKRKVEVFEEEMMLTYSSSDDINDQAASTEERLIEQALHFHTQGLNIQQIASELSLSEEVVEQILYGEQSRGVIG